MDLHDVQQQQQHAVQHSLHPQPHIVHNALHDIHHHQHTQLDHHLHIAQNDQLFRPFYREPDHFQLYNNHDIFQGQPSDPPTPPSPPKSAAPQSQPPLELANIDDEPLYVNAKQYFRILKRRVARTRLERGPPPLPPAQGTFASSLLTSAHLTSF
ncbi:hypothetical protein AGABI2DRAFT_117909 [Agaricus bisporus var. bisporus H97]|uniref:hypothetical protein n=1 Tax=Agaricus bisporus var. bisporus (strain H97 / ATCC MYA-4626 / FGSC 10389) TaxID=936046 RepID=UPI00029F65CF|nr:hypothetical protein AGABI2DRAFT_117909 [Agaricus bisporus var. bisporus H97]EKV47334.1 hypothetical protein AGABI2DRAFT_117909 [Agaricus bisporus var. bisporus H97]